jgi:hypothetical protein
MKPRPKRRKSPSKSQRIRELYAKWFRELPEPDLRDRVVAEMKATYRVDIDASMYHKAISRSSRVGRPMRARLSVESAELVRRWRSRARDQNTHPERRAQLEACAMQLELVLTESATEWTERYRRGKTFDDTVTD